MKVSSIILEHFNTVYVTCKDHSVLFNAMNDADKYYAGVTSGLQPTGKPAFGGNMKHNETEGMNCTCLPQCTDKSYSFNKEIAVSMPEFSRTGSLL